jgi:SAM-dependent methyltransferase
MDVQTYWDQIYRAKSPEETSWYQPHLQTSLHWISEAAQDRSAAIIDVGGGESTLVDDLYMRGYHTLTVLDVADAAIKKSQERLGPVAQSIHWLVGDVTTVALPLRAYDLWHDRAVFHFLTRPEQRLVYVRQITSTLKAGGQVIISTFGPEGPQRCSGLNTKRYDAESLHREMGPDFQLVRSSAVEHQTPFGATQQFLYCQFSFSPVQEGVTS